MQRLRLIATRCGKDAALLCVLALVSLEPLSLMADPGPTGVVYDVTGSGHETEAVSWIGGAGTIVAGIDPINGNTVAVEIPVFSRLEVRGYEYTFYLPSPRGPKQLTLLDVRFRDPVLFKDTIVCGRPATLSLKINAKKAAACREVFVPLGIRQDDWDACAFGYQTQNWNDCPTYSKPKMFYEVTRGLVPVASDEFLER